MIYLYYTYDLYLVGLIKRTKEWRIFKTLGDYKRKEIIKIKDMLRRTNCSSAFSLSLVIINIICNGKDFFKYVIFFFVSSSSRCRTWLSCALNIFFWKFSLNRRVNLSKSVYKDALINETWVLKSAGSVKSK